MRDTLTQYPFYIECCIVYLNTSDQPGSHWVCYYRKDITPVEILRYLRGIEFKRSSEVIQRITDIVQTANTSVCGHLCLFVSEII